MLHDFGVDVAIGKQISCLCQVLSEVLHIAFVCKIDSIMVEYIRKRFTAMPGYQLTDKFVKTVYKTVT